MSEPDPPGPATEAEKAIIASLRRIVRAIDLQSRHLASSCGLTGPQLVTLRAIETLGAPSLGELAGAVSVGKATLTGIVDRLERRLLVARARHESDRRKITVSLTHQGEAMLESAPPLLQDRFRAELQRLNEWERSAILATLQRVASMLQASELDASPVLTTGSLGAEAGSSPEQKETT